MYPSTEQQKRFHTTMVLTQPRHSGGHVQLLHVSIPLWFLRNSPRRLGLGRGEHQVSIPLWFLRNAYFRTVRIYTILFPYHYGSHSTRIQKIIVNFSNCFHTTMVLTQQVRSCSGRIEECSRFHTTMVLTQHEKTLRQSKLQERFPYHYGSHSTAAWEERRSCARYVSIPLWFSLNDRYAAKCADKRRFPYHYGSHSTSTRARKAS